MRIGVDLDMKNLTTLISYFRLKSLVERYGKKLILQRSPSGRGFHIYGLGFPYLDRLETLNLRRWLGDDCARVEIDEKHAHRYDQMDTLWTRKKGLDAIFISEDEFLGEIDREANHNKQRYEGRMTKRRILRHEGIGVMI